MSSEVVPMSETTAGKEAKEATRLELATLSLEHYRTLNYSSNSGSIITLGWT